MILTLSPAGEGSVADRNSEPSVKLIFDRIRIFFFNYYFNCETVPTQNNSASDTTAFCSDLSKKVCSGLRMAIIAVLQTLGNIIKTKIYCH